MTPRRELVLFIAAALVPAALVATLGLRALQNEEAALRREALLEVQQAADGAARSADRALGTAALALGEAELGGDPGDADERASMRARVSELAPPFSVVVVLSPQGALLEPAERTGGIATPKQDDACDAAARALDTDRAAASAKILADCPDARDDAGRWLFPVLAMRSAATAQGDAAQREIVSRLSTWLGERGGRLRPAEREALDRELREATLPGTARAALLEAVGGARATKDADARDSAARVFRSAKISTALSQAGSGRAVVELRDSGVRGALVALPSGGHVGFLTTPETLARGLSSDGRDAWLTLEPGLRAVAVSATTATANEDPRAVGWLIDGLGIEIALADPATLVARTTRSRRVLGAVAIAGAITALGLAGLVIRRARDARRTGELRTTFVAAVSHELRTPLASVRLLSELLAEERVEDGERREVAEALAKEARRMSDTVERFMTFARMDRGRLIASTERLDVGEIVADRVSAFRLRHPDAGVEYDATELIARVDRTQLEIVVDNLLENAAKYAPAGGPYRVSTGAESGELVLSVSDAGPGVPAGMTESIFRPFERGDDRLSRATSGTGLGLSLVRGVAEAHGGRAWVERLEPGSRFVVRWPLEGRRPA